MCRQLAALALIAALAGLSQGQACSGNSQCPVNYYCAGGRCVQRNTVNVYNAASGYFYNRLVNTGTPYGYVNPYGTNVNQVNPYGTNVNPYVTSNTNYINPYGTNTGYLGRPAGVNPYVPTNQVVNPYG